MSIMKKCPKCKYPKFNSDFYKDANSKDGLAYWCKSCASRKAKKCCSLCKQTKHKTEFSLHKRCKDGLDPRCKECKKIQSLQRKIAPTLLANKELSTTEIEYLKALIKRKKIESKRRNVKFNLTYEWAEKQFKKGCAVTGIPLELTGKKNPFSLEVDRIDPGSDYVLSNCRFVCSIYNKAKWTFTDQDVERMIVGIINKNWAKYSLKLKNLGE